MLIVTVTVSELFAKHAILHGYMTSPWRHSALYCGLRLKFDIGRIQDPRLDYWVLSIY